MEDLMVQLETAQQERVKTLKEFMRLKNELALAQRRCDELRSENNGLKTCPARFRNGIAGLACLRCRSRVTFNIDKRLKAGSPRLFLCPQAKYALQFDPSARHGKCAVDFFKEALQDFSWADFDGFLSPHFNHLSHGLRPFYGSGELRNEVSANFSGIFHRHGCDVFAQSGIEGL